MEIDFLKKQALITDALDRLSGNLSECCLCPRQCRARKRKGEVGFCGVGTKAVVASSCLHFGEEPCLSGYYDYEEALETKPLFAGSGTVFFTGCNLRCVYCQNHQISWESRGCIVSPEELASIFLSLQKKQALNLNLVTPSHTILAILHGLLIAFGSELSIPIVYNTSSYDSYETLLNLNGIMDIYLADFKYFSKEISMELSKAPDYPEIAKKSIREMYRQVGDLELDEQGIARKGLIIRHLILPGAHLDSCRIIEWIAQNLSNSVCLSLMSQYHPCNKIPEEINRKITEQEYNFVIAKAEELGFEDIFIQPYRFGAENPLLPDFNKDNPFS